MKLKRLRIQNFRCLKDELVLDVGAFTSLIGRNEAGKSTVLESLAVFFGQQNIDKEDACKSGDAQHVMITCEFVDFPTALVLDSDHQTSLSDEQLLNEDRCFQVRKTYDCTGKRPAETAIDALAYVADDPAVRDLMGLKLPALKKRLKELGLSEEGINLSISSDVRKRIREHFAAKSKAHVAIPLDSEYGKQVWAQIEPHLPSFALFKSDRESSDQDDEAQDPLNAALKEALKSQQSALSDVTQVVKTKVTDIAKATLLKLQELDPALASQLDPVFAEPDWSKVFKISLSGDGGVAINKRGSGVRRLILLSFFRAKAEQVADEANAPSTIYAVEEPETSQHPDNQRMLCYALLQLSSQPGCQVIISTHTPGLARTLPLESLRFLSIEAGGGRKVHAGSAETYARVYKALGVHPDNNVRLFIHVEGQNDIEFLQRCSKMLAGAGEPVLDLQKEESDGHVIFVPVGGGNLIHWRNRLANLNTPEFHLYDKGPTAQSPYQEAVTAVNQRAGCKGVLTGKLEMENYLHPSVITAAFPGVTVAYGDMDDVPMAVAKARHALVPGGAPWDQLDLKTQKKKESQVKTRLNTDGIDKMTPQLLTASDPNGDVRSWFGTIKTMLGEDP